MSSMSRNARAAILAAALLPLAAVHERTPQAGQPQNGAPNGQAPNGAPTDLPPMQFFDLWDLGKIDPGQSHTYEYQLSNACKPCQPATFKYPQDQPAAINGDYVPLTGPKKVYVPGEDKCPETSPLPVEMTLEYPYPPPAGSPALTPPPNDPDDKTACSLRSGFLTVVHDQLIWDDPPDSTGGFMRHICQAAEETYLVTACLGQHWPDAPLQGGALKKRPKSTKKVPAGLSPPDGSTCSNLWYFNVFVPSGDIRTPEDCAKYIRAEAHHLFDNLRLRYPAADWAFVPTGPAIDQLTVEQILAIKVRVFDDLTKLAA